jgi:hypothetical protein
MEIWVFCLKSIFEPYFDKVSSGYGENELWEPFFLVLIRYNLPEKHGSHKQNSIMKP